MTIQLKRIWIENHCLTCIVRCVFSIGPIRIIQWRRCFINVCCRSYQGTVSLSWMCSGKAWRCWWWWWWWRWIVIRVLRIVGLKRIERILMCWNATEWRWIVRWLKLNTTWWRWNRIVRWWRGLRMSSIRNRCNMSKIIRTILNNQRHLIRR